MSNEAQERLLRMQDLAERLRIGKSTVWYWLKMGILPKPIRFGTRFTAWRESDVQKFIEDMAEGKLEQKGGRT